MDAGRVSADLFGRSCRLPIAMWILEGTSPGSTSQSRPSASVPQLQLGRS